MAARNLSRQFGLRVRELRLVAGLTQEQFASKAGLHRTHVSLIERGQRSVRIETVDSIARALGVDPVELFQTRTANSKVDRIELVRLRPAIREYQDLATRHGIDDIFQDNGGKLLQTLILLDLKKLPGREGNDAVDEHGREYELKSVNVKLTRSFSTDHHLNPQILAKYRAVTGWYFSTYEHIELTAIYYLAVDLLEPLFEKWQRQWDSTHRDINNPKIPLTFVATKGLVVYSAPDLP